MCNEGEEEDGFGGNCLRHVDSVHSSLLSGRAVVSINIMRQTDKGGRALELRRQDHFRSLHQARTGSEEPREAAQAIQRVVHHLQSSPASRATRRERQGEGPNGSQPRDGRREVSIVVHKVHGELGCLKGEAAEAHPPRESRTPSGDWEPMLEHVYQCGFPIFAGRGSDPIHGIGGNGIGFPEVDLISVVAAFHTTRPADAQDTQQHEEGFSACGIEGGVAQSGVRAPDRPVVSTFGTRQMDRVYCTPFLSQPRCRRQRWSSPSSPQKVEEKDAYVVGVGPAYPAERMVQLRRGSGLAPPLPPPASRHPIVYLQIRHSFQIL